MNQQTQNQMAPENPRKKIIITSVIIFAILIAMGIVAWYFFFGPGKSTTSQITNPPDKTAKWFQFESKTFGYTIKYPADWEYKTEGLNTTFRPKAVKEDYLMGVYVKNDTLSAIIDAQKTQFAQNSAFLSQEEVTLAGEKATRLTFENNSDKSIKPVIYLLDKNSMIYILTGEGAAGDYNEIVLLMIDSFVFKTASNQTGSQGDEISFDVLAAGSISSETKLEVKNYTLKTNSEFKELWDKVYGFSGEVKTLPEVDFNKDMVIAVVASQASSGGFEIEISKILEKQDSLEVTIKETSVAGGCPATMALNQPFEFVKLATSNKEVKFIPQKETKQCE